MICSSLNRSKCIIVSFVTMLILGVVFFTLLLTSGDLFTILKEDDENSGCTLDINDDLTMRHPLILKPSSTEFLMPGDNGKLNFYHGEEVFLSCPGRDNHIAHGASTKEKILKCVGGTVFLSVQEGLEGNFKEFTCKDYPDSITKKTDRKCFDDYIETEIGFEVSTGFVKVITTCFDEDKSDSLYSSYVLSKSINHQQVKVPRPGGFDEGEFYPNLNMNDLYSRTKELSAFAKLLKSADKAKEYISLKGDFFLSRGHMTAKADFVYGSQQRATFFYVNVAPQWQIFNEKNWNSLEQDVRQLAGKRNQDFFVSTGVWGNSKLPDVDNHLTDLYLHVDQRNGLHKITVPEIYWKLVYDPKEKTAVGFVGHNNPYEEKLQDKQICNSICDKLNIKLHWRADNVTLGYSYCCEYQELKSVVPYVPDLEVNGLLI